MPVEGYVKNRPYSGYKLRIYNDLCDTGELLISVDSKNVDVDYTKPYYDLGSFTFSYLRDKDTQSTLYGNFFIVEFIFNDEECEYDNKKCIEFESLEYQISYEEN